MRQARVERVRVCSGYAKSMEGKKRGQMGQEVGRRGRRQRRRPSSKASLDAAASSTPSVGSHPPLGTVDESPKSGWRGIRSRGGGATNQIINRTAGSQSATSPKRSDGWSAGGCDLQTQWSERFRLETMRTFPAALEMGIAQHTTRGEDRPLLSPPIVNRIEKGFRRGGEGKRVGRRG